MLRDLSRGTHPYIRDAKIKDLPDFFFGAMRDKSDEVIDEAIKEDEREDAPQQKQSDKSEKTPSKFTEELLQNSELIRDVPMRMSVGGTCNVLVTRLLPGHTFNIATFVVVIGSYSVESQDVQFAIFRECELGGGKEIKIIMFKLDDGQFAFAVPRSLAKQFQEPPTLFGFSHIQFVELDQIAKLLPSPRTNYIDFTEQYVILHGKAAMQKPSLESISPLID